MLCVPCVPSHQSTLQSAAGGRDNGSSLYQVCTLLSPPSPPAAGGSIHQHNTFHALMLGSYTSGDTFIVENNGPAQDTRSLGLPSLSWSWSLDWLLG